MATVKASFGKRGLAGYCAGCGVEANPRPAGRTGPDAAVRRRICTFVRDQIALGRWTPGVRLPDRLWFKTRFHCTFTATQAAFDQLRCEGFVKCRTRAGTVATDPPPFSGRYLILCRGTAGERNVGDIAAMKAAAALLKVERGVSFEFRDGRLSLESLPEARAALLADIRAQRWAGAFIQPWSQIMADIGPVKLDNVPVCIQAGRIGVGARGFTGSCVARIIDERTASRRSFMRDRLLDLCAAAGRRRIAIFDRQAEHEAFLLDDVMDAAHQRGLEIGPFHYQALQMVGRRNGSRDAVRAIMRAVLAPGCGWQPDCVVLLDDHWLEPLEDALAEQGEEAMRKVFVACVGNAPMLPSSRLNVHFAGIDYLATLRSFIDWCDAIHVGDKSPSRPSFVFF